MGKLFYMNIFTFPGDITERVFEKNEIGGFYQPVSAGNFYFHENSFQ